MTTTVQAVLQQRQLARSTQLLEGIILGLVADGELHDREIVMLRTWLTENEGIAKVWPGSTVSRHLEEVLADGHISDVERVTLLKLLTDLVSGDFNETGSTTPQVSGIPFDEDCLVDIRDKGVCLTGSFLYGTRADCERISEKVGASMYASPSKKVSFLVVGTHVSPDWLCQSYGRKIQSAMGLRDGGHSIAVIPERRWFGALGVHAAHG